MRIIDPSIEVVFHVPDWPINCAGNLMEEEMFLERVGRTCYKSEDKITEGSARKFIKMLARRGHHAMLEHCVASAHLVCNRGVTHELVRHRLASYAQESTRYCDYTKDKHGGGVTFIRPPELKGEKAPEAMLSDASEFEVWRRAMQLAEMSYNELRARGVPPQIARGALPIDVKTEIWITANLREWMHLFRLRCASTAHPHIRRLMLQALSQFADRIPSMFADLAEEFMGKNVRKES